MQKLNEVLSTYPLVPFIREADFAIRKPWYLPERRLLDYLIIYIQEGHCLITVEKTSHSFGKGDFCLIQPENLHTLEGTTNTITPFAHLDFFYNSHREESFPTRPGQVDLTHLKQLIQPKLNNIAGIDIPIKFEPGHASRFRENFLKMVEVWQHKDVANQLTAQHLASALFLDLIQKYGPLERKNSQSPASLNWITSYFSLHLSEKITIEDMAQRAQLSSSRFSSLFQEKFGLSPYQYLLRMRIQHAQDLLHASSLSLEQIAEYCGFADIHHFSKMFKKITKQSPGSFRRQLMP